MKLQALAIIALASSLISTAASADSAGCMGCHDDGEFAGMSAGDITAALKDTGIPPHKKYAGLSAEELQAIAAELAGG